MSFKRPLGVSEPASSPATQEKKQALMTELDNTVQQPRKPKPGFITSKTEKLLQQKYATNGTQSAGAAGATSPAVYLQRSSVLFL